MRELTRRLSPATLFMLSLNGIIGSGWLFAPLYAAKIAGPAAILSWIIGGVAAILISFTFAEISTTFPIAGGTAYIPQLSHGAFASFIMSWIGWITAVMLAPIEVQAVLQYAALFFPSLMHTTQHAQSLTLIGYFWASVLMVALCLLNIISYRGLVRFNFVIFIFKFSVILLTIFAIMHAKFNSNNFAGFMLSATSKTGWQAILSAIATGGVVLAFNGFKSGVEMAGEAKKLSLAIPLSTVGSVFACLLIYLGLQICFIGALPQSALKEGWQHLNFTGDIGPFVGLTAGLGLFWLLKLLYTNSMVSPLGAGLIYVTATARILYAMSRIGYVPAFLTKLNKQHFPVNAIIVNLILGMLSFLPLPGWQAMMSFLVSAIVITYAMGPIALLSLRFAEPDKKRLFKLPFANVLCLVAFYFCNLFSYWTGWETISKLAIILLCGIFIFIIAYFRRSIQIDKEEWRSIYWIAPYLSGLVLISYLGSFGGRGIIPFGLDFLVIGIFSSVILYLAVLCRITHTREKMNEYLSNSTIQSVPA